MKKEILGPLDNCIVNNLSPKFSYEGIYERVEFLEKALDGLKEQQKIISLLVQCQINTNNVIIKFLLLFFSESFFEFNFNFYFNKEKVEIIIKSLEKIFIEPTNQEIQKTLYLYIYEIVFIDLINKQHPLLLEYNSMKELFLTEIEIIELNQIGK